VPVAVLALGGVSAVPLKWATQPWSYANPETVKIKVKNIDRALATLFIFHAPSVSIVMREVLVEFASLAAKL
jgi:hypothetical protein